MWETIKEILSGENATQTFIFIIVILCFIIFGVKGSLIKISTPHVKIGVDEIERAILRQQTEWTLNFVNGLYGIITEKYPQIDPLKTKYVLERIYDEIVIWIMFNHITRSEMYIMVKQEKLRGVVFSMDVSDVIRSDEFTSMMNAWTKEIVNRLVDIREYYSKHD